MSPLGMLCILKNKHLAIPAEQQDAIRLQQGRANYGVDMRIVDGDGQELPWNGKAYGDLLVKGPWVVKEYFKGEGGDPLVYDARGRGCFPTGNHRRRRLLANHRPQQGRDQVRRRVDQFDRNRAHCSRPSRRSDGCVHRGFPSQVGRATDHHRREAPGREVIRNELLKFYEGKTAKWQIPDGVVFVEAIPLGVTGKILKTLLRE
jgi:acyl-CoA synthetase (AMP-forming)/AMP-acid ligase II